MNPFRLKGYNDFMADAQTVRACEGARYFIRSKISFKLPKEDSQQVPLRASQSRISAALPRWPMIKCGEQISHGEVCDSFRDFNL